MLIVIFAFATSVAACALGAMLDVGHLTSGGIFPCQAMLVEAILVAATMGWTGQGTKPWISATIGSTVSAGAFLLLWLPSTSDLAHIAVVACDALCILAATVSSALKIRLTNCRRH